MKKTDLAAAHAFLLVPGTPEWDLVWELVSAHSEDHAELLELEEPTDQARARQATSEALQARMDAFAVALGAAVDLA